MPTNVVKGSWCRGCYNLRRRFHGRHSLHAMRDLAISRGGVCLATEYLGSKVKLSWECTLGHRWQAAPSYVIQGQLVPGVRPESAADVAAVSANCCYPRWHLPLGNVHQRADGALVAMCRGT